MTISDFVAVWTPYNNDGPPTDVLGRKKKNVRLVRVSFFVFERRGVGEEWERMSGLFWKRTRGIRGRKRGIRGRDKREGKRRKSCGTRKHRGSIEESATDSCEQAQTCLQRPKVRPMAHLNPTSLQT